jgi:hypothetical protein
MITRPVLTAAASVVGVLVAGTAAVGANIGILTAADSSEVGELSAAVDTPIDGTAPVGVDVVEVYLDDLDALLAPASTPSETSGATPWSPSGSASDESSTYEAFTVDAAGEVVLENDGDEIDVESVTPAAGYSSTTSVQSDRELTVTFDGPSTLVFHAVLNADGTISASVEAPVVVEVPTPSPTPTTSPTTAPTYHDDDDDEHDDDYDDDDDEHDDDEHDEHDEHEGRDDDD